MLCFILGCSSKNSVRLLDDLQSYQTQSDVIELLGDSIEFSGNRSGLSRAQVNYEHLDEKGKLGLLFFEDKLAAVGFYPSDTSAYLHKLSKQTGHIFSNSPIFLEGVEIGKGYDYEMGSIGGLYISWGDRDLVKRYEGTVW